MRAGKKGPGVSWQGEGGGVRGERVQGSRGRHPPVTNDGRGPQARRRAVAVGCEMTLVRRGSMGRRGADMRAHVMHCQCDGADEWDLGVGCCGPPWAAAAVGSAQ
jgi:hypothetical protein